MTPTQAQLDEFARRLRTLEDELADLRRRAAAETPTFSDAVLPALHLLGVGQVQDAVEELERQRAKALDARSIPELEEILEVAREAVSPNWPSTKRLVYAVEQNIRLLRAAEQSSASPAPRAEPQPPPPAQLRKPQPPAPRPEKVRVQRVPRFTLPHLPQLELSDLFGARALALAGGVVTLLGIVFFFVIAVNRGWVGPMGRVGLGGSAALSVFLAGFELRRRYGTTDSALAAVGTGIAGGYATLLAAAALYDLLPDFAALGIAAAIAATCVATSVVWRSQIVAGFGLLGAMLVPVAVIAQSGLSPVGTAFVVVVFAATGVVASWVRWRELLVAGALTSAPQIAALAFQAEYHAQAPWRIVALAGAFSFACVAAGLAYHLRNGNDGIGALTTSLTFGGGALAAASVVRLYGAPSEQGLALLAIALSYALIASVFLVRRTTRDLGALLATAGFTLGAFAVADLFSGQPLAYVWAAEGAAVAWLAHRTRDLRFQVWSVIYVLLALVHVLIVDIPPERLFVATAHPERGALTAAALGVAASVFAFYARPRTERFAPPRGVFAMFGGLFALFHERQRLLRSVSLWFAGVAATYSASFGVLAFFTSLAWAWVALAGFWSLVGLCVVVAGLRLDAAQLRWGGLASLAVAGVAVVVYAAISLPPTPRSFAFLVLAVALFAAGAAYQHLEPNPQPVGMDVSAQLAAAAIAIGAVAAAGLLDGEALAYTWAAEAAVLAWFARLLRAPHLQAFAIAPLGLALVHVFVVDAPPGPFLAPSDDPARGALTALAAAISSGVIAASARAWPSVRLYGTLRDSMLVLVVNQRHLRSGSLWLGAVVATYALSLATLALVSSFDWGWVALAGIWSSLGLAALLAGLRTASAQLRGGGLIWLATATTLVVTEGFDALAPTPRSTAFVIIGATLLAAGLACALRVRSLELITVATTGVSLALTCIAIATSLRGQTSVVDRQGAALLGLAILYGAITTELFRRHVDRDLMTLYAGIAIVLAGIADAELLDGTYAVLGWAGAGASLALLSARVREPRFLIGAAAYLAVALGRALVFEAPPSDLFVARPHPAAGAPAILAVSAAIAAFAYLSAGGSDIARRSRRDSSWIAGVLAVYGLSLTIVEIVASVFDAGLQTEFQRGHTAVSAFWGVLGLVLLYAGLKRWRSLRIAGLALFAVSLGKIFLYDLPSLSSITRALSFLAVGAVLLLGGFFYQRLSATTADVPTDKGSATR